MTLLLRLLFVFICSSCTSSHLRRKNDFKNHTQKYDKIKFSYVLVSNMSSRDEEYWSSLIEEKFRGEPNLQICSNESCACQLKIKVEDDQEVWSSWKVWVSGLSLGLIPIKFNANYSVIVRYKEKEKGYHNSVDTWAQIFLLPVFFLTPSKEMETKKMSEELIKLVNDVCS